MVQNELILVLQYAHLDPQLYQYPGLAFADPLRVRLKYREYLLVMWDDLPKNGAAPGLVGRPDFFLAASVATARVADFLSALAGIGADDLEWGTDVAFDWGMVAVLLLVLT